MPVAVVCGSFATVRAAYVEQLGPASAIRCGELPEPRPGPGEVLVDVTASTVNPVDTMVRSGLYRTHVDFPFVIGRDLVGTVVEAPANSGFAAGAWVWCNSLGHAGRQGAAAQRAVVPTDRLYCVPAGVPAERAVAVVHPAATAHLALLTHGKLQAGETVVVAGGAGNVGSATVELASRAGARVVATAAAHDAEHCAALGAHAVLDYRDSGLHRQLERACPNGADLYVDTSGANDLDLAVDLLADRGRIVLLAGAQRRPELPAGQLYMKNGALLGFVISGATVSELASAAETINELLARGRLRPRGLLEHPLDDAAELHERMERGELHGRRVVLRPQ